MVKGTQGGITYIFSGVYGITHTWHGSIQAFCFDVFWRQGYWKMHRSKNHPWTWNGLCHCASCLFRRDWAIDKRLILPQKGCEWDWLSLWLRIPAPLGVHEMLHHSVKRQLTMVNNVYNHWLMMVLLTIVICAGLWWSVVINDHA